mmetsp:Transcript_24784/g.52389  ORF Transcript_24784/g.52389 Transcript_24784/m.52389 type:complete len:1021 (-) Transcript_24784:50-3112(-)
MSGPEWMSKFQEIGQKEEEDVTELGRDGFLKRTESRRTSLGFNDYDEFSPPAANANANINTNTTPAAAIDAEGTTSRSMESSVTVEANNKWATTDGSDPMVRSNRSDPPDSSSSTNNSPPAPLEPSENVDDGEDNGNDNEEAEEENDQANKAADDGFGESWVVDHDRNRDQPQDGGDGPDAAATENNQDGDGNANIANGDGTQDVAAATRSIGGDSFITEEYFVDENGNELFLDENGNEIQEEVVVDEEVDVNDNDLYPKEEDGVVGAGNEDETQKAATAINNSNMYSNTLRSEQAPPFYDIEEQKRILGVGRTETRSRMSWFIPLLACGLIFAAILLVVFFVVLNDDRQNFGTVPTMAPTGAVPIPLDPTASSSSSIDAAATTYFDPVRNSCNFLRLVQPNVIDQCKCDGSVDILADDIRARWEHLVNEFVPTIYPQWDEPVNSCSPENQALLWLSSGVNNGGEIDNVHRLQRYVLAIVYYVQGGTGWTRSANWMTGRFVCEWEGVECNKDSFVRVLRLDQNRLTGTLSDAPTLLNAIEGYSVAKNSFIGSIPESYFLSESLTFIDFSGCELTGALSAVVNENSSLTNINLSSNNLDGFFPQQIWKISGLKVLNLESNAFFGPLPNGLFSLPLIELSIGGNYFDGTIPEGIGNLSALTSLSLGPNLFTGAIPVSLSKATNLERVSVVGIPSLGGRLPASYGISLTNLIGFSIANTNVDGNIPPQFSMLTNLKTLRLNNNNLRGMIPSSVSMMSNLENLHLNGNSISGTVPSEIAMLSRLQELELDNNALVGTIPDEFESLRQLRTLTFVGNFMDGRAPSGVCALREAQLNKFVVDCPILIGESKVNGIICVVPNCCTECFNPNEEYGATTSDASSTIVGVASQDYDLSFLVGLLTEAGLVDPLSSQGPFTVFAPVNSGVLSLLNKLGLDPSAADGVDPNFLYSILAYHVVSGSYSASDITDGLTLTTAMGESISFAISGDIVTVNGEVIIVTDIPASNGVIHKIDGVLMPSVTLGNMVI